jgi:hypothetical protein
VWHLIRVVALYFLALVFHGPSLGPPPVRFTATDVAPNSAGKGDPGMGFRAPLLALIVYPEMLLGAPKLFAT